MANKKFFAVMLAMALAFGLSVAACNADGNGDNGTTPGGGGNNKTDPALNGTWVDDDDFHDEYIYNNGICEKLYDGKPSAKATYTTSGESITFTTTHEHGDKFGLESRWYTMAELYALGYIKYPTDTSTYTIKDNKLYLRDKDDYENTFTLTKKS